MKKGIGDMIAALRNDRHMTQQELADKLNCSKQTISNYERGTRTPDYKTLEAIADILNTTMSMFLSEDEQRAELERIFLENMSSFSSEYTLTKKPSAVDNVDKKKNVEAVPTGTEPGEDIIARIFPKLTKAHQELVIATAQALLSGQAATSGSPDSTGEK